SILTPVALSQTIPASSGLSDLSLCFVPCVVFSDLLFCFQNCDLFCTSQPPKFWDAGRGCCNRVCVRRDGRVLGVLEVSRSIGDGQYKRCGVISTPDVRRCQLSPNDRFVLLACDGLFKVFSADEAVQFILNILENETVEQKEGQSEEAGFEAACQRLASEAVRRGSADNVTVILVSIEF
uniref:PPM-type phosphatase domain-containing protein n=1 Tax=Sinocyclocheilus anshuiensis TaxID=1608454 RepID=A0A671PWX2_9TELE